MLYMCGIVNPLKRGNWLASSPGHSQILSRSYYGCEIKSGSGMGMRLAIGYFSDLGPIQNVTSHAAKADSNWMFQSVELCSPLPAAPSSGLLCYSRLLCHPLVTVIPSIFLCLASPMRTCPHATGWDIMYQTELFTQRSEVDPPVDDPH